MSKRPFDKELFKRSVIYNVKTLYRRTIEEATPVSYTHLDVYKRQILISGIVCPKMELPAKKLFVFDTENLVSFSATLTLLKFSEA